MYKIESKTSGYILTFAGEMDKAEMERWRDESKKILEKENRPEFGVIVDMKDLVPLQMDVQAVMVDGQKLYKNKGMKRSAVILQNDRVCSQFKNLAIQSGIYATERYLDAQSNPDFLNDAVQWVKEGIDPDN